MAQVADEAQANAVEISLLKDEKGGLLNQEGIASITFYKGDFKAASAALQAQLAAVVAANPWLAGRLVRSKPNGVVLRHPASPSEADVAKLFTSSSAVDAATFKLSPSVPYMKICADMYKSDIIVTTGASLVDKDKPVVSLTLAESTENEFALIFSMSHTVGDGRTYYEVWKMLSPGAEVRSLAVERVQHFSETMRDACGRKELAWSDKPATMIGYTCGMMFNPAVKVFAFNLDAEKLAAAKAAAASAEAPGEESVPYVTTNDVLVSGFFNECGARIAMMGMDCREKLEGFTKDMAGNYVTALVLDPGAFGTPATMRRMFTKGTPYQTVAGKLPGCCTLACSPKTGKFAQASNWASMAGGMVQFEGCELVVHLPVVRNEYITYDMIISFASGVGKVGVICWTVSSDEAGLRASLPVGEVVSKELFP